ncbi:MAG TPA: C25 family cysteine peptidase, partial [Tenuifilaceae bacterium]|nr:C25 family cysteine peptidase [Tenuifilaceae bacterium]
MKNFFIGSIISISLLFTEIGFGQEVKSIKLESHKKSFSIQKSGSRRLKAESSIEKLLWKSKVEKTTTEFTDLYLPNGYYIGNIGDPKLPAIKKLILVPANASLKVEVKSCTKKEMSLSSFGIKSPLVPVQPSVKKSQDPCSIKFEYNKSAYSTNKYSNTPLVTVEYLGTMRGIGVARVVIAPVSYNPIKESIIVSNDIDFDILVNGSTGGIDITIDNALKSNYFDPIYLSIEKSAGSDIYTNHKDLTKNPTKMLIVTNRLFEEALNPFVKWKARKGFEIETVFTDEIGSSSTDIKHYISKVYNSATESDPAPTFLVIAGDTDMVPASAVGSASERQTDLYYASIDGDYFPEMYYGRLSASTVEEMNNIVSKILHYEQYQFEDPTYLSNITLIAGDDAQWNPQVGQATIKYGTANYFNANKGFNSIFEYGVSNDPNNPSASAGYDGCYQQSRFRVGIINYTAHCDEKHWQDPELTQTAVRNITNTNHYPVAIGNCCLSGDFGTEECIGETWIRQKNTGAVTYIGSSPSTYWYEDFYWSVGAFPMSEPNNGYVPSYDETTLGAYDAPFVSDYTTLGAMVFVGNLAVTEVDIMSYPSQSSPLYYWQAYNILGDPSISPYFAQAHDNRVTLPESVRFDQKEITIEALPNSLVALNADNQTLSKGVTDKTGKVTLSIRSLESPQEIECVITKAQRVPFIKPIKVLPAEQAYITATKTSVNDAQFNNNGIAEYGEDFMLDLTVANYGETNGENIAIAIYNKDKYFSTLSDTLKLIGNIDAKTVTIAKDAFAFGLATNVPNQHKANIEVHSTDGVNTWVSALILTANAPSLELTKVNVTDSLYGNNDNQINPGDGSTHLHMPPR